MTADPAASPPDRPRRRPYPYPRALRRVWRHPAVRSMNDRRLRAQDDLRGRLESYASRRARFRPGHAREHYTARDIPESRSYAMGIIRPGDMGAAVLYALGIDSYDEVRRILSVPEGDPRALPLGTDARSQAALIARHARRRPALVVDVRCGRGEAAATLVHLGIDVLAFDPSVHAGALVEETAQRFYGLDRGAVPFEKKGCYRALKRLRRRGTIPDAVIFCESIEHMPEKEVWRSFDLMSRLAGRRRRRRLRLGRGMRAIDVAGRTGLRSAPMRAGRGSGSSLRGGRGALRRPNMNARGRGRAPAHIPPGTGAAASAGEAGMPPARLRAPPMRAGYAAPAPCARRPEGGARP